jgi:hypothetical protein
MKKCNGGGGIVSRDNPIGNGMEKGGGGGVARSGYKIYGAGARRVPVKG